MIKKSKITAQEVAKDLGVSISTVGRAMADDPRISGATKARVREAVARLRYVQSMPARVMRGASSNLVALVVPDISNDFYSTVAQSLSKCCERQGYRLVLSITGDSRDIEANQIRELSGVKVAGVFIVPAAETRPETASLLSGIPYVQLLRKSNKLDSAWFGIDDERCVRDSAAHLIALGHRSIAYLGVYDAISTGPGRRLGFWNAFAEAHVDVSRAVEKLGPPTVEFGLTSARQLFQPDARPTAVVCGATQIAVGLLEAVSEFRIRTPEDLSIVGFGDSMLAKHWGPGLTTIQFPIEELATSCCLWFLNHLATRTALPNSHSLITSSTLIVRGSTAPLAKPFSPLTTPTIPARALTTRE